MVPGTECLFVYEKEVVLVKETEKRTASTPMGIRQYAFGNTIVQRQEYSGATMPY